MSEHSSPNKDKETILKYMQLQQELQDAYTQQALGYMTAMTEVVPMVSAGKGLVKSAQAMAKPDVLGMRPTARITNEPLLIADQYEEARRLSDELEQSLTSDNRRLFEGTVTDVQEDQYIREASPSIYAPNLFSELEAVEGKLMDAFGAENIFKDDGTINYNFIRQLDDEEYDTFISLRPEIEEYERLHKVLQRSKRQTPEQLRETFERLPETQKYFRDIDLRELQFDIAASMRQKALERELADPKNRARFDSMPEVFQRSPMYDPYIPEYEDVDTFRSDPIDFGQPDFLDTQFEGFVDQEIVPPLEYYMDRADELIEKNFDEPLSDRDISFFTERLELPPRDQTFKNLQRLKELEPEVNAFLLDLEEGMRGLSPSTPPASQAISKNIGGLTEYYEDEMKDKLREYYLLKGEIEKSVGEPLLDVRLTEKRYPELRRGSYQQDLIERMTGTYKPIQIEMQDYITVGDQEKQFFDTLSRPDMRSKDPKPFYTAKVKEIEDKVNAMRQMERYNPNLPGVAPRGVDMSDAFADYAKARAQTGLMFLPVVGGMYEGMMGAEEEQRIKGELDILREQMTDEERAEAERRLEEQRPKQTGVQKYR